MAAAEAPKDTSELWNSVFVIAYSSLLVGCALAQLNALTGDASATGALALTTTEVSVCTAALYCAAGVSSIWANVPLDRYGRKQTLLRVNACFVAGGACTCFNSFLVIAAGRSIIGVACGIALVAVPTLLAEIAPPEERGSMGVIHLLCINGGVCLAAIIAYPFVMYVDGGWRWANLTFSLMPCVQLALHGYVLESPLWKQPAERDEAAAASEAEDDDLKPSWWDLREPLAVGATLAALQPLTGINIFTSYSTAIYKIAGLGDPIVGTIVGNVSLMACSCLAVLLVERMGRRDLLRMSCSIMTLSAVVVGVSLYSSTDEGDDATPETAYTTLLGAAGFLGGFSLGCGPVLWVLIAETFPTSRRSQALGGLNTLNAFVNLAVVFSSLFLVNALAGCSMEANIDDDTLCGAVELRKAVGELMLILAFVTAITVVFVTAFVEETAGSDLEALDRRYCCLPSCVPRAKPPQKQERLTDGSPGPTPPPRRRGQEERPLLPGDKRALA